MSDNGPEVRRDGDAWLLTWPELGLGFGVDHLRETSDGLHAELTVESVGGSAAKGRLAGPLRLNILSARSQTEIVNKVVARANGSVSLKSEGWEQLVSYACAVVSKQYRDPSPILNLAEVEASSEVEYLLPGLAPLDETTVLYGDGESMKSLTALRVAFSVMTGAELPWGTQPTRKCPVLYLDWETNPRTVAARLRRVALGEQAGVPAMFYRQCLRSLADELPHIREEVSKKGIGLVIVDSIGFAANGALVEDETARSAMNALRLMTPATRLVIAHVSAETARQTTGAARPFGSAFFWNGMRSGLELRRAEEGPSGDSVDLGMYHRKANDGEHHRPIGLTVTFEGRGGAIAFDEANVNDVPDLAARTSLSSRLRLLLRKGQMDTAAMAAELEVSADTVSKTLKRMPDVIKTEAGGGKNKPAIWGLAAEPSSQVAF